jgi:hypothetical protein
VSIVLAALLIEVIFRAAHLVPQLRPAPAVTGAFALDATFGLNTVFGLLALYVAWLNKRYAARSSTQDGHAACCH